MAPSNASGSARYSALSHRGETYDSVLPVDPTDLPDLTDALQQDDRRIVGRGSFAIVYRCACAEIGEVAVKAILLFGDMDRDEIGSLNRKMRRELAIWRRLDHPNIVPLLGTARGNDFASEYLCMVSAWMSQGTLISYMKQHEADLRISDRVRLIKDVAAGLEYLHSKQIVHGDFHPGNILIDGEGNAQLTDFGYSHVLSPMHEQLSYLETMSRRPGAAMWAAPEQLFPGLYPSDKVKDPLKSDIYSLSNIFLFILSAVPPWKNLLELDRGMRKYQIPQRPTSPQIPNSVWNFMKACWSPRLPSARPSAQEVSSSHTHLERLMLPTEDSSASNDPPNILIVGETGVGKSCVVNLIAGQQLAEVHSGAGSWTMEATSYDVVIPNPHGQGLTHVRLFDTVALNEPQLSKTDYLTAIEKANTLICQLQRTGGIRLLIFCFRAGRITATLQNNYRLFCDILCQKQVPVAFVITGLENEVSMEGWWERNASSFEAHHLSCTSHACVTATPGHNNVLMERYLESQVVIRAMLLNHVSGAGESWQPEWTGWFIDLTARLQKWTRRRSALTREDLSRHLQEKCRFSHGEAEYLAGKIWAKRQEFAGPDFVDS